MPWQLNAGPSALCGAPRRRLRGAAPRPAPALTSPGLTEGGGGQLRSSLGPSPLNAGLPTTYGPHQSGAFVASAPPMAASKGVNFVGPAEAVQAFPL